jgi:hypothetical protein
VYEEYCAHQNPVEPSVLTSDISNYRKRQKGQLMLAISEEHLQINGKRTNEVRALLCEIKATLSDM